jgi:hypothetical protein
VGRTDGCSGGGGVSGTDGCGGLAGGTDDQAGGLAGGADGWTRDLAGGADGRGGSLEGAGTERDDEMEREIFFYCLWPVHSAMDDFYYRLLYCFFHNVSVSP